MGLDQSFELLRFVLSPAVWVVDGFTPDGKLLGKFFDQHLYAFYLTIGWANGFSVRYYANADSPALAVPGAARDCRVLSLPSFCRLYLSVAPAEAVTYTEVVVGVFRICQAVQ